MIERRAGADERLHHLGMAEMRCGDQGRAVPAAGDVPGADAQRQRHLQRRDVVGYRGDGDDVIAVILQRIHIGAGGGQRAQGVMLACVSGHVQRRAAMAVAGIDRIGVAASGQQRLDARRVAALRGIEQSVVAHDIGGGGRHLRLERGWRESCGQQAEDAQAVTQGVSAHGMDPILIRLASQQEFDMVNG